MSAVVSLRLAAGRSDGLALVHSVAHELAVTPRHGADGSWEFCLRASYPAAHQAVVDALSSASPDWRELVTVEYVLAV